MTTSSDDKLRNIHHKIKEDLEKIHAAVDPQGKKVKDAVDRMGLKKKFASSGRADPEVLAEEDAAARQAHKREIENSTSHDRQEGESDIDYQMRIERLRERENRRNMTGAEVMERDALKARLAKEEAEKQKLEVEPNCKGTIIDIKGRQITVSFDPQHPIAPKTSPQGHINLTDIRGANVPLQIGMTGVLVRFNQGEPVWRYFFKPDNNKN